MSNLIPTPRSDKNGRIVIRHVKQSENRASDKMPAPALGPRVIKFDVSSERIGVGAKEIASIRNPISRWQHKRERAKNIESLVNASPLKNSDDRLEYSNRIEETLTSDEVKLALAVTRTVTRSDVPNEIVDKDRTAVIQAIDSLTFEISGDRVRALHANMDWLRSNPGEAWKINRLTNTLREYDIDAAGDNGKIPNLDAYLEAQLSPLYENVRRDYETHSDFLIGVATRPDKLDQLAAYVMERGFFDEDGFEQYLNTTTPLAEGSL